MDIEWAKKWLEGQTEEAAKGIVGRAEMLALSGCTRCGRRLVENDEAIKGAVLVKDPFSPEIVAALCPKCYLKMTLEQIGEAT